MEIEERHLNTFKYNIINTSLGKITIVYTDKGICAVGFGEKDPYTLIPPILPAQNSRRLKAAITISHQEITSDWKRQLEDYFQGKPVTFDIPLDIYDTSSFRKSVWRALQSIPYGETRSYRWVAEEVKKSGAFRAVGQANAANPIPIIIPCHRVIRSDGSLGGFSSGLKIKKVLLRLEGILLN